jgi:predicted enzyme related to lactoylglutathione lyase
MEMPVNAVAWFDIPVADFDRARTFYSTILDYEMPEVPMGGIRMGIFPHVQMSGVGGAIVAAEGRVPANTGSLVYLPAGQDLSVVLNRVVAAGGTIVIPKTMIAPGMGYFATFGDTEGNAVGLHSIE